MQFVITIHIISMNLQSLILSTERRPFEVDVIFVLDSSSSVGDDNFELIRNFVADVISHFKVGPEAAQVKFLNFFRPALKVSYY